MYAAIFKKRCRICIRPERSIQTICELNLRMGTIYLAMNDFDKARNCFKAILRQDPAHEEAINQLASMHAYSGDAAKAYQMLAPLLQSRPVNISAANTLATFCRPLNRCQEATELLEERLTEGPLTSEDEMPDMLHAGRPVRRCARVQQGV